MRYGVSILACAALVLVVASAPLRFAGAAAPRAFEQEPVPASPTSGHNRAATIEAVRFGFDGYMLSDAWTPIRVYVSGNPTISGGAFAGAITLDFAQDTSQSASITTSFATTPGRVTPVEIIGAVPRFAPSVNVQIRDMSGGIIHERTYWRASFGDTPLPAMILDGVKLVVAVADRSGAAPSIARALRQPEELPDEDERDPDKKSGTTFERMLASCVVREDELPLSEAGFGAVAAVVVRSDVLSAITPQKLKALSNWVESGGCMIVLAGAESQAWLAAVWNRPPFSVSDVAPFEFGEDSVPRAARAGPRPALSGRILRLDRPIAETGWRVGWTTSSLSRHDGEATEGLIAQGPVGFGWIVVLGVDPASLGTTSAQLTQNWLEVLRHAFAEVSSRPTPGATDYWRARGSGEDFSARLAIKTSLDSMIEVPALGDGAFLAIAGFLVLLAIALGPVDALVLRRAELRAWSWATAIGWIILAAGLAAFVPPLIRTGDSTMHRLRTVDAIQSEDRSPAPRQVALTSLFANAYANVIVSDPDREKADPIGWFRGVSSSYQDEFGRSQPLALFPTLQAEARGGDGSSFRNNAPSRLWPLSLGQWTLRSFMSSRAAERSGVPVVQLSRSSQSWTVTARGMTGKRVEGWIRVGGDRFELESTPILNQTVELQASTRLEPKAKPDAKGQSPDEFDDLTSHLKMSSETLLALPGARDRTRAVDALVASGGWACVVLFEKENTPTLDARGTNGDGFKATESTLWRILVPLDSTQRHKPLPLPTALVSKVAS